MRNLKTRLLSGAYTPKTEAASKALDAANKLGGNSIQDREREANVVHIVRLFQIQPHGPDVARAKTDGLLSEFPDLGRDVRARLELLGILPSRSR